MRNRVESEEGFTLIELLVVILIIGILAAIAIPSFLNQREKGQDACAKSMARTMQTAMETYFVDNNTYTGGSPAALTTIESQVTNGQCGTNTTVATGGDTASGSACGGNPSTGYCVLATSAAGTTTPGTGRPFMINRSAAGAITRTCGSGAGGSGDSGNGGACANGTW
ncbi:MAG: type IV pilin protein [Solirubrobacterales bacterium]